MDSEEKDSPDFTPPPPCLVFSPTEEEFQDPLAYIAKIRPVASKTGICKIKPPPDWQPPFAAPVDTFSFVPRIQRLNELEARSRVKLNFLDRFIKFWELQGTILKIPQVGRKVLDMQALYRLVEEEGGMEHISKERKWSTIASKLGFPTNKGQGSTIRSHYERLLYPYYLFKQGQTVLTVQRAKQQKAAATAAAAAAASAVAKDKKEKTPSPIKQRKSRRLEKEDSTVDYNTNAELKKLQFYGAGPKAAVPPQDQEEDEVMWVKVEEKPAEKPTVKTRIKKVSPGVYTSELLTQIDRYHCGVCGRGDGDEYMLLCDGCDDAFHTYCLMPQLPDIPKGEWRCPSCVKQACSKPAEQYGFEQSKNEYNLQSFGEMADHFKTTYFNMPVHKVTTKMVEKEFWRLVSSLEEDVCVLYGADIHAKDTGSGFPTKGTPNLLPEDEEYINSGWNLNNLPVQERSVLGHINGDISGMKIPWCYVGMCFSSFCWHIEDHWSYSINYLHWGEPKTWYGCPGESGDQFEEVMRQAAPELFEQAPDLLHQLTTIMNPNVLIENGVPIYRTDQHAGEFVVTFPRAYHAGFNNGYNFAEAVNFCPADWLPMGRLCIEHYRTLHRQCVFSHEELICKMAADPDSLELSLAAATHKDMIQIVDTEKKLRKRLLDRGTVEAEREAFELLPDDERQCTVCRTTCFLSSVTCSCSPSRLVCLYHVEELCNCSAIRHCLRYRYTLDELPSMLHRLKMRAESFNKWSSNVRRALNASGDDKLELGELQDLVQEAEEKKFPVSELKNTLAEAITEAEKCASVACQLVSRKVRTRNRQALEGKHVPRLTLDELNCFYEQVLTLPCRIPETSLLKDLVAKVVAFQEETQEALTASVPDSRQLEKLIDIGVTLDVDLPEIPRLKEVLQQAHWLDEMYCTVKEPNAVTLEVMRKLIETGVRLAPHPAVESAMAQLQEMLTMAEHWEEKAGICLTAKPCHMKSTLEGIINESKNINANLPNVSALQDNVRKANEWIAKVEAVQTSDSYPYLDVLEGLVTKGRGIAVRLDQLPQLDSQVAAAKAWRERTARTFLKKNSTHTLLEVLAPRADIGVQLSGKNRKKKGGRDTENNNIVEVKAEGETRDPATILLTFKRMEGREVDMMRDLRTKNMEKVNGGEGNNQYCVCRKAAAGFMLQCELCKDWFHGTCVPLPKSVAAKAKPGQQQQQQQQHQQQQQQQQTMTTAPQFHQNSARDFKFLCPMCLQSRRPRLETILSLLVSLQKLPVRLAEGEALQCLTERAMAWQDRARQMLATPQLSNALATLSVLSQRRQEQAAREKTEKIISAELRKAASNPELQGHLASVTQSAFGHPPSHAFNGVGTNGSMSPYEEDVSLSPLGRSGSSRPDDDESMAEDIGAEVDIPVMTSLGMSSEHAYSSVSKMAPNGSPRKPARKSPLTTGGGGGGGGGGDWQVMEMSDTLRATLEELMMEGDLLEVTLDETQHIWKLLQACHGGHTDSRFLDFQDTENMVGGRGGGVKEGREKKMMVKRMKNKDGLKVTCKVKVKMETKALKRKRAAGTDKVATQGTVVKVEGGVVKTEGGGGGGVVVKKMKQEAGVDVKPLKKKWKQKDKVQLKVNKTGFQAPAGKVKARLLASSLKKKTQLKVKLERGGGGNGEPEGVEKRRRVKKVKVKKEREATDKDSDDNDDDCSATKCLRPIGEAVPWVQCDSCELWFHLLCVGLGKEEITEEEDYVCYNCRVHSPLPLQEDDVKIKLEPPSVNHVGENGLSSCHKVATTGVSPQMRKMDSVFKVEERVVKQEAGSEDSIVNVMGGEDGEEEEEEGRMGGGKKGEGDLGIVVLTVEVGGGGEEEEEVEEEEMEMEEEDSEEEEEGGEQGDRDEDHLEECVSSEATTVVHVVPPPPLAASLSLAASTTMGHVVLVSATEAPATAVPVSMATAVRFQNGGREAIPL